MAHLYRATVTPSKLELLTDWLPGRSWFPENAELRQLGSYRFDDPDGDVGLETLLVEAGNGGPVLQLPLTYRAAPMGTAEVHLVGVAEHSVLGRRWVYDGCGDPIWVAAAATAALIGGTQAEELVDDGGRLVPREPTVTVRGSGKPGAHVEGIGGTGIGVEMIRDGVIRDDEIGAALCLDEGPVTVVRTGGLELVVVRVVGAAVPAGYEFTRPHTSTLTGRWAGGGPADLVCVTPVP